MASVYSATAEGEEALAAATAETVLSLIGASATKARLIEWGVSFDGTSPTAEAVRVRLIRLTANDGTNTGCTIKKWDTGNPTANCVAKRHYTVEPTKDSTALAEYDVHPQAGLVVQYPLGREPVLDASSSAGVAIECTAPATVNVSAYLVFEE